MTTVLSLWWDGGDHIVDGSFDYGGEGTSESDGDND